MLQYHVFEMLPFPADFQRAGIQTSIFQAADSSPENFSETLLSVELGTPKMKDLKIMTSEVLHQLA